jgi:hypothetical protein
MKRFASIIVLTAVAFAAPVVRGQNRVPASCSAEIRGALAVALDHSLRVAKDLPDFGLVARQGAIYILSSVWENECLIDKSVLPRSASETYVLVSPEELADLARQRGDGVAYVRAGGVRPGTEEVRLWLGVAMQQVPGDKRPLLCCCGGEVVIKRMGDGWEFSQWKDILCA